jgi:hypothetical protein
MKTFFKLFVIALIAITLTACGKAKLDTSSKEAMNESSKKVMAELSPEDQERFQMTLLTIYMSKALSNLNNPEEAEKAMLEVNDELNGKTAEEIFKYAEKLQKEANK